MCPRTLQRYVGVEQDVIRWSDPVHTGETCGIRSSGTCAGDWLIHDVQTERFHTGPYTPHDWWSYLGRVHGALDANASGRFEWDEFMAYSMGFYVDDLATHLDRFENESVAHLRFACVRTRRVVSRAPARTVWSSAPRDRPRHAIVVVHLP